MVEKQIIRKVDLKYNLFSNNNDSSIPKNDQIIKHLFQWKKIF